MMGKPMETGQCSWDWMELIGMCGNICGRHMNNYMENDHSKILKFSANMMGVMGLLGTLL